jgi:hypothetical protein
MPDMAAGDGNHQMSEASSQSRLLGSKLVKQAANGRIGRQRNSTARGACGLGKGSAKADSHGSHQQFRCCIQGGKAEREAEKRLLPLYTPHARLSVGYLADV